jgi:hypothetical protein
VKNPGRRERDAGLANVARLATTGALRDDQEGDAGVGHSFWHPKEKIIEEGVVDVDSMPGGATEPVFWAITEEPKMGNQRAQRRVLMSYNPEHTVCYGGARLLDIDGEWLVNDVFVARSYAKALRQLGTELVLRAGAVGVLSPASTAGRIAARSAGLPLIKKNPAPGRNKKRR